MVGESEPGVPGGDTGLALTLGIIGREESSKERRIMKKKRSQTESVKAKGIIKKRERTNRMRR